MASFAPRIEIRDGARFEISDDGDLYALREMYEMGEGRSVYLVEITEEMRLLDIGAHKGFFSVWAAKQGARVTAYEPDPKTYEVLLKNLVLNNVIAETRNQGVWSCRGLLPLYYDEQNSIGSSLYQRRPSTLTNREVSVESFDEVLGSSEWDLVKLDAEEAEYEILLSANRLEQIKQLVVEWHCPHGEKEHSLFAATVEKLSKFFDIPVGMTSKSWPVPMRRLYANVG